MRTVRVRAGLIVLALGVTLAACNNEGNGNSTGPTGPSPSPAATVTLTATGASPKQISIRAGETVQFTNSDSVAHQIRSNPHPVHTDCPPVNEVATLAPGQSRSTGALAFQGACGFHDHTLEEAGMGAPFRGVILVDTTDTTTPPVDY